MARARCRATVIGAAGLTTIGFGAAPTAYAYESWCDLVEVHSPKVALISEPLRTDPNPVYANRLNSVYDRVIPQLQTVAQPRVWFPVFWGTPDIRADTQELIGAMRNLQDAANDGRATPADVQGVDDAIAVIHSECDGRRGLPPHN